LPDDLINRRSSRELSVAFSNLPIDLREAMALVVIEELSYRDASQVLGVSLDTLFDRLKRARTLLASRADTGHGAALRLVK
jgi:RNA polymerase sigma-70 factor (ECF subfamily)